MNQKLSGIAWGLISYVLLTGLTCYRASPFIQPAEESSFQKGMAFPTWDSEQYGTVSCNESLRILAQTTCTEWVQLVPTWYQNNRFSNAIFPDFEGQTARMESLRNAIQTSHDLGLKVMLKPHVDSLSGDWRGTFEPQDPIAWFNKYEKMMEIYAQIAQDEGVEILSIGCEFVELTSSVYTPNWKEVIHDIRGAYSGSLVYAANWGRESLQVEFWDDLDFIGIDAYFELTNMTDPEMEELLAAWTPHIAQIESIYRTWQKPILLTEIGYRSIDGANMRPWDWEISGEIDLEEQAQCFQAVIRTFKERDWFEGIYWWNWEPDPSLGGPTDKGYTPYGKPAGKVLESWYCEEALSKKGRSRR
jgi:hypothetical protein